MSILEIVNHCSLTCLMKRRDLIGRLAKFQIVLVDYGIIIEYRPKKENSVCVTLSRYIGEEKLEKPEVHDEDTSIRKYHYYWRLEESFLFLAEYSVLDLISVSDNTSYLEAHYKVDKTKGAIRRRFYWTGLDEEVREFVKNCVKCQSRKPDPRQITKEPMGTMEESKMPSEKWHISILEPLPQTEKRNRYVLSMKDAFRRWIVTNALLSQDAETNIMSRRNGLRNEFDLENF
uniref:RNA-directed DNA polymerase n=1 Tax=Heterorhabditis bacteriophora TaxID=37862 RepID=A0A1I7WGB5_HETBA